MFAIEVEYLLGRVFAGDFRDRSESEWPPHPSRLYSALVAAHFDGEGTDSERAALEWLEGLDAPSIHAGSVGYSEPVLAFVPTNYPGDLPGALRGRQPRFFPARGPSQSTVHFIWLKATAEVHRNALDRLVSRTGYLGKASSLVRMRIADNAPTPNFIPDSKGEETIRIPRKGRMEELEAFFASDQRPSDGALQNYRHITTSPVATGELKSSFGAIEILRRAEGVALPVESTLTVTEQVRKALIRQTSELGGVPELLYGRGDQPHCGIAALPAALGKYADGHLMGVAIVFPANAPSEQSRLVIQACSRLTTLNLHALGLWTLERQESIATERALRRRTWTEPSRDWSTVTPILLDRFPKKHGPTVEDILAQACRRIGLPDPIAIRHGVYSAFRGIPPVPQFRLQRERDTRARWGVHATLEFAEPVSGPVLLGAGRFYGLGLCQPLTPENK